MRKSLVLTSIVALAACGGLEPAPAWDDGFESIDVDAPNTLSDAADEADPVFDGRVLDAAEARLARPGDVVTFGGRGIVVPEPGHGVTMSVEPEKEPAYSITLAVLPNGEVRTFDSRDPASSPFASDPGELPAANDTRLSPACKDGAFSLEGSKWKTPYAWWFRANSTPAGLPVASAEAILRNSAARITTLTNDCGLPTGSTAKQVYKGRTGRGVNMGLVNHLVGCGMGDGFSVQAFGPLDPGVLGLTCGYFFAGQNGQLGEYVEADVRYRHDGVRWSTLLAVPTTCRNTFFLSGVAVHEFGHVFGLGHVSELAHPTLTMSTQVGPCSNGPATLGKGDVLGMRRLY